ncbi:hypothetical protein [Thioclava sp. GXIMD4216]|uniref:hypothetical protein n=1 Tax=Thioclava sp. GXIMD4216 TaxID=3131929 RepID=UPI0030D255BE
MQRKVLICVLAVSLLGNALAIGAGLRLMSLRAQLTGPVGEAVIFPREIRRDLRDALAENRETLTPALQEVLKARARIVALGTAQPFDRAATEAAMGDFRRDLDALLDQLQPLVLDRLDAHHQ